MLTLYHGTGLDTKTGVTNGSFPADQLIYKNAWKRQITKYNGVMKISDNMSSRDKTKSNTKPGRDLNVVFWLEKSGQNQVFGMATLAEYKTRNIF